MEKKKINNCIRELIKRLKYLRSLNDHYALQKGFSSIGQQLYNEHQKELEIITNTLTHMFQTRHWVKGHVSISISDINFESFDDSKNCSLCNHEFKDDDFRYLYYGGDICYNCYKRRN